MVDAARSEMMSMVGAARAATCAAARATADPGLFTAGEADQLVREFDRIERAAAAVKVVLAGVVADSAIHVDAGAATPAAYLAKVTGTSVGAARDVIATSKALPALAATKAALLEGVLSVPQAHLVADGAKHDPAAEAGLLSKARRLSHTELRSEVLRAKAAADPDPDATHARIHANRRCADGTDAEGAWTLHAKATAVDGSVIKAELDVLTDQIFRRNRSAAAPDRREQYRMDALRRMAENSRRFRLGGTGTGRQKQSPPQHLALLRVDVSALQRGRVTGEELCEITGIGPIPLARARAILGDAVLRLVLTKGVDVANVTSLTRGPNQAMRYAELWANPICEVDGCPNTILEYDHTTGAEYTDTRHTKLDEIDRLCSHHHRLHTRFGWALTTASDGTRVMVPPEDRRHPASQPPPGSDGQLVGAMSPEELRALAELCRDALDSSNRNLTATASPP
jgi:hypothetical protein